MTGIIIKRGLSVEEINEIKQIIIDNDYQLYSNVRLPAELKGLSVEKIIENYNEKKLINYKTLETLNNFGDKVIDNKTISQWLTFDKAGVWHYHKFRIYFLLRNLKYELSEINYFAKKHEKIFYYSTEKDLKLCRNLPENVVLKCDTQNRNKTNYFSIINYTIFFILRVLTGLSLYKNLKNKKHILIDHTQRQSCLDINTFKIIKDNYNLAYLFDKIDDNYVVFREVIMPKFNDKNTFKLSKEYFCNINKKNKRFFSEIILFKALLNQTILNERHTVLSKMKNSYSLIEQTNLDYDELLILKYLKSFHHTSKYYIFRYLAFTDFFCKHKFQTISTIDENSAIIKTILDAGKICKIKTFGIQHGNIYDLQPAYMYTRTDAENEVMADKTLVWGEFFKDILINKGNFKADSIEIVGQIRTDIIGKLKEQNKSFILRHINADLPENKKIVVFASQPMPDAELRKNSALNVFNAVKGLDDVVLVIKLHPAEKNDIEYYSRLAIEAGCSNYVILYFVDLFVLLAACDILITCYSTVASETVYFYKPVIILDQLRQDLLGYHKEGVALQACNVEDLKEFIVQINTGKLTVDKLVYENFINKYAYRIDGKVAERICRIGNRQ